MPVRLKLLFIAFLLCTAALAQIDSLVYPTSTKIDTARTRELSLVVDNLTFFKNNEFKGTHQDGYTLPGLWLRPRLKYVPFDNLSIEAGAHALYYYGAKSYPGGTYAGIPTKGEDKHTMHVRPFLRLQANLFKGFDVVLGNIYGGANHRLDEPLYNQELNLTADPEMGVQVRYDNPYFFADGWINWQHFQFHADKEQEMFVAGVSTQTRLTPVKKAFQLTLPVQVAFRHIGGEIDSLDAGIQTRLNLAAGLRLQYAFPKRCFVKSMAVQGMFVYSGQLAGNSLPFDSGFGVNSFLAVNAKHLSLKAGYWHSEDFDGIQGSPAFSNVSYVDGLHTFDTNKLLYGTLEYCKSFGKNYALGAELSVQHHFNTTARYCSFDAVSEQWHVDAVRAEKKAMSVYFGVYLRITPSFRLCRL